jgi:hypothetical protein
MCGLPKFYGVAKLLKPCSAVGLPKFEGVVGTMGVIGVAGAMGATFAIGAASAMGATGAIGVASPAIDEANSIPCLKLMKTQMVETT